MKLVGKDNTKELDDAGKKKIGLGGGGVEGLTTLKTENRLEGANGALHGNAAGIECIPLRRTAKNARIEAFVGIGIDIDAAPIGRR